MIDIYEDKAFLTEGFSVVLKADEHYMYHPCNGEPMEMVAVAVSGDEDPEGCHDDCALRGEPCGHIDCTGCKLIRVDSCPISANARSGLNIPKFLWAIGRMGFTSMYTWSDEAKVHFRKVLQQFPKGSICAVVTIHDETKADVGLAFVQENSAMIFITDETTVTDMEDLRTALKEYEDSVKGPQAPLDMDDEGRIVYKPGDRISYHYKDLLGRKCSCLLEAYSSEAKSSCTGCSLCSMHMDCSKSIICLSNNIKFRLVENEKK